LAQTGPRDLELRFVSDEPDERRNPDAAARYICKAVRADLSVRLRRMAHIVTSPGGKREDILDLQPLDQSGLPPAGARPQPSISV
jgi:hypothetical protein